MSYLSVKETARALSCSVQTIRGMIHAGRLPAVRVGRVLRVPASAVSDYPRVVPALPEGVPNA